MADVHLPRSLVSLFPGAPRRVEARGSTVAEVIADLDAQVPGDPGTDSSTPARASADTSTCSCPVSGQRSTPVPPDAVVHVIPAVSGG